MNVIVERILWFIDNLNERVGRVVAFLTLVIMANVVIEVFARYCLNSPTVWSTELNEHLMCGYAALAGGYVLLHGSHVSVDIVQERLKIKVRMVVRLITSLFAFLFVGVLIWTSWLNAMEAWEFSERSESIFAPPLFPIKVAIPIGACLLLLQMIAGVIRDVKTLATGVEFTSDVLSDKGES